MYTEGYVKAFVRKGAALLAMKRPREAAAVFDEGLKMDPFHLDLRSGMQGATQQILADLLQGRASSGRRSDALMYRQREGDVVSSCSGSLREDFELGVRFASA